MDTKLQLRDKEREKLSKAIHPLFRTRGVPGTHDCKLILKVIKNLTKKKEH